MTPEEACRFGIMELRIERLEKRLSSLDRGRDAAQPPPEQNKPLRLLVEVVDKKDEKHTLGRWRNAGGLGIATWDQHSLEPGQAMSVKQLPPMPTLSRLGELYTDEFCEATVAPVLNGIRAVLRACGLEVKE